jgi:hypothetical protein
MVKLKINDYKSKIIFVILFKILTRVYSKNKNELSIYIIKNGFVGKNAVFINFRSNTHRIL